MERSWRRMSRAWDRGRRLLELQREIHDLGWKDLLKQVVYALYLIHYDLEDLLDESKRDTPECQDSG